MAKAIIDEQSLTDIADAIRTKNGSADTYTPAEMATAITDLPTPTPVTKGLVFSDYDSNGYPHKAEMVGSWTEIPTKFFYQKKLADGASHQFTMMIDRLAIPDGVQVIKNYAFGGNNMMTFELPNNDIELKTGAFYTTKISSAITIKKNVTFTGTSHFHTCSLTSVTFGGEVNTIPNECFKQNGNATIELYDFSHCSAVPPLYSVASLSHKSGCVIKVPQSLLAEWQAADVWKDLTNVVWQGV